ncbi:MAG: aminodeoxychorismate synthase component I [Pseudomonadota bacterium]
MANRPAHYRKDHAPFVLLDDASGAQAARLYRQPVEEIAVWQAQDVIPALKRLEEATQNGLHAAGYLGYEAGLALEPRLAQRPRANASADAAPLMWFGLFENYQSLPPDTVDSWLAGQQTASRGEKIRSGAFAMADDAEDYASAFQALQQAIRDGDIYQANLTGRASAHFAGDPIALYHCLRRPAAARYAALVHHDDNWFLSLSPELFFTCHQGRLTARPMKGTLPACPDRPDDAAKALAHFAADSKNRAENLMIVDLLRNDLSRIARPGSVTVPDLFHVEHYPTVHQMVSTVRAELTEEAGISDILQAIYPCGSITGAPKIRAMELIDAIEPEPRGIYCGAIGRIDATTPGNGPCAAFNVAIRTLHFSPHRQKVMLGLGSGIVADSDEAQERRECLDKGAFAMNAARTVDLIETMALDPRTGIARLEAHLARMKASAEQMAYAFDRHATRNTIQAACFHLDQPSRIRLMVSRHGNIAIDIAPLEPLGDDDAPLKAIVQPLPVHPDDPRLKHKTTDRAFYDDSRKTAQRTHDVDEILFTDPNGFLTEGSFTHVFAERNGQLLTPPLSRGLLPGILRAELLTSGKACEGDVTLDDLADGFFVGNSVRGLLPARLAQ